MQGGDPMPLMNVLNQEAQEDQEEIWVGELVQKIQKLKKKPIVNRITMPDRKKPCQVYHVIGYKNKERIEYAVKVAKNEDYQQSEIEALHLMTGDSNYFPVLYHVGQYDGYTVVIMDYSIPCLEYFRGMRGEQRINCVFKMVKEVLYALCDLASQSLTHGDIKPGNIVFIRRRSQDGVEQGQFGLIDLENVRKKGELIPEYRTPGYTPEPTPKVATSFVDLFALGRTAYELLTNESYDDIKDRKQLIDNLQNAIYRYEDKYQKLVDVIKNALVGRYKDPIQMIRELRPSPWSIIDRIKSLFILQIRKSEGTEIQETINTHPTKPEGTNSKGRLVYFPVHKNTVKQQGATIVNSKNKNEVKQEDKEIKECINQFAISMVLFSIYMATIIYAGWGVLHGIGYTGVLLLMAVSGTVCSIGTVILETKRCKKWGVLIPGINLICGLPILLGTNIVSYCSIGLSQLVILVCFLKSILTSVHLYSESVFAVQKYCNGFKLIRTGVNISVTIAISEFAILYLDSLNRFLINTYGLGLKEGVQFMIQIVAEALGKSYLWFEDTLSILF